MSRRGPEEFNVVGEVKVTLIVAVFWAFFVFWYAVDYDGLIDKRAGPFIVLSVYLCPAFFIYQFVRIRKNIRNPDLKKRDK